MSVEPVELLYITHGNLKWYNHAGEYFGPEIVLVFTKEKWKYVSKNL